MSTAPARSLPSDDPLKEATRRQQEAANPAAHAWVDASAGSGKTTVLISRVLRLLLSGCAPHRILCLTFTKAAATNMANRLSETLARWAVQPEEQLIKELIRLTETNPDEETVLSARHLFARTLEAPSGMQFLTIHGFCQSLLARFPLEANVPLGFNVLDEQASMQILAEIRQALLTDIQLAPIINRLLEKYGPDEFPKLESEVISSRSVLEPVLRNGAGLVIAQLRTMLGVDAQTTEASYTAAFKEQLHGKREEIKALADAYTRGGKADAEKRELLLRWLEFSDLDSYLEVFLTQKGELRAKFAGKPVLESDPTLEDRLSHHAEAVLRYTHGLREVRTFDSSWPVITYAAELLGRYTKAKQQRIALDYDDLIVKATELVTHGDAASWVLFKLDGGIDHVLVDEAQDTNPLQWTLLKALTSEFTAGDGQHDPQKLRTIFAVGDFKQSIFSFQGARPQAFLTARDEFKAAISNAGQPFRPVDFIVSFRSVAAVLDVVDATFRLSPANEGLPDYQGHRSAADMLPGIVELWPPAPADLKTADESWVLPTARRDLAHPRNKLANVMAAQIHHWVTNGETLPARGRAMQYGDILVLVRTRGSFVGELIRACKREGVPVAGADRMLLLDQLAVEDVLAFIDFLLLPQDDLTLATLLRSPFIGISEQQLYDVAYNRPATLWQALGHNPATRPLAAWMAGWLAQADRIAPYTLIAKLLAEPCPASARSGRHALVQRLGPDANDPLDELLSATLNYEQTETPSLQGYMGWIRLNETSIKREMEQAGNQLRIMTAHGSKGLEAPVVILADALRVSNISSKLLTDPDGKMPPLATLPGGAKNQAEVTRQRMAKLRQLELEEYHRLLYVALTRAEDWLVLASWSDKGSKITNLDERDASTPCWIDLVKAGMADLGAHTHRYDFTAIQPTHGWIEDGLRYQLAGTSQRKEKPKDNTTNSNAEVQLPAWVLEPPAPEPSPARPLTPSKLDDDTAALSPLEGNDTYRWQRGLTIHRLLQTLPELPHDQREPAALRWLGHLPAPTARQIWQEVQSVLTDAQYAPLFGPASKAEVPITGVIGSKVIAGQIDRLAVLDDAVWIIDFKTNRPPARQVDSVPAAYIRQLASYRAVLTPVYKNKPIKAALLWTHEARLMVIPDALLDAVTPSA